MRIFKYALLLTAVCATAAAASLLPLPDNPVIETSVPYTVKSGDTLYDISAAKLNNPQAWHYLIDRNPILSEPGRQFRKNGKDIVVVHPGETILGLDQYGKLMLPDAIEPPTPAFPPAPEQSMLSRIMDYIPWIILALAGLIIGWMFYHLRNRHDDPAPDDSALIRGGITATTAPQALSELARRRNLNLVPGSIVSGRASGLITVSFAGGRREARDLKNEPAFMASAYNARGIAEPIFMLLRCGNDLTFGGVERYIFGSRFRFVPDPVVETAPVADVEPAPVEAAPDASAVPEVGTDQAAAEVGTTDEGITVELQPAEMPGEAALIRVTGALTHKMTVTIGARSLVLRHYPPTN